MTTTTEPTNGTALAVREFSDTQLQQRIKANISARFGLQDATPAQLNTVFLQAKRWALDPINEITLYEGRIFITLDGRLQLMRRNPDYRGYRTRPLSRTEREDWGYEPDDVVVECTILTHTHGEITERGCVRRAEIDGARARAKESGRKAAPVGIYGPEIAEKRAIARSSRAAFGQDVPDEDEVGYIIEERNDPERNRALAAQQVAIFGSDDDGTAFADQPKASPAAPPTGQPAREPSGEAGGSRGSAAAPVRDVTTVGHPLWRAWIEVTAQADAEGIEYPELTLPLASDVLQASTTTLLQHVDFKRGATAEF